MDSFIKDVFKLFGVLIIVIELRYHTSIIESYPVICKNGGKPQRVCEYVNRTITTPIWDKSRTARTTSDGSVTYKPKRDVNGVILCKSELDQESCIYADKVRAIRQKEDDTIGLYSESEASLLEQKEKLQCDFITYFKSIIDSRHKNSSDSIIVNWNRVYGMLIYRDCLFPFEAHIFLFSSSFLRLNATLEHLGEQYQDMMVFPTNGV